LNERAALSSAHRRRRRTAGTLAVAAGLVIAACGPDTPEVDPSTLGTRAERPAVRGDLAYGLVQRQVDFGPRVPGSDGHRAQLAWMVETLTPLADTVFTDTFSHTTKEGVALELTNVHAVFGPQKGRRILLLAHWDTRPTSDQASDPADKAKPVPGANDGASGVAVLLELARLFHEQAPPTAVELLFVDGEDYGPTTDDMFLGARHYARTRVTESPPLFGVLLDMVGDTDLRLPMEGYSLEAAPQVVQRVWGLAQQLGYGTVFVSEVGQRILDDHLPLIDAGVPTIDLIDFDYGPGNAYWHTPLDTPDKVSPRSLEIVGEVVAELVYRNR